MPSLGEIAKLGEAKGACRIMTCLHTSAWARLLLSFGVALSCGVSLPATRAVAADISVIEKGLTSQQDQPPARCNVRLRGDLAAGDAEKLRAAYNSVEPAGKYAPSYLCLDSPGGSFSEALRILRWLIDFDTGIATVIEDRARCLSACAIIFLGGSELGHLTRYPRRWLHAGGQLGFHTPYIGSGDLSERAYTADEMLMAFATALASSRELATQFARVRTQVDEGAFPKPWVKTSLFLEMLLKGPNEMLFIDTVDKIGRWEIDLFGVAQPRTVTLDQARGACRNAVAWLSDRSAVELHISEVRGVYSMDTLKQNLAIDAQGTMTIAFWLNGREISSCRFSHHYWGEYGFAAATATIESDAFGGANRAWIIYPPATKLSSLPRK